jgi:hypothetical protein
MDLAPSVSDGAVGQAAGRVGLGMGFGSGLHRGHLLLLLYTGLAWFADAMEVTLLSYLGPAVSWLACATAIIRAPPPPWLAARAADRLQLAARAR